MKAGIGGDVPMRVVRQLSAPDLDRKAEPAHKIRPAGVVPSPK